VPNDFTRSWIERCVVGRREGDREGFVVIEGDETPVALGFAPHIARETATVELGYVVAPEARGRGIACATLAALSRWAFADLGVERCELLISVENVASGRVAERCGYVLEGVVRSMWVKPGLREDMQLWSRLSTDPPPPGADG
jgi:RimJ/RimL family protein N-acetyltransferase